LSKNFLSFFSFFFSFGFDDVDVEEDEDMKARHQQHLAGFRLLSSNC
jgi:hypothetical protein